MNKKNLKKNLNLSVNTDEKQITDALASIDDMKKNNEPKYINIYWEEWKE
ncbi:hypothetical protein [Ectobacillus panaciterrae]|nr:hypothetical protein [Ectobacillus panaciterrae]